MGQERPRRGTEFIGVYFKCCRCYQRAYLNSARTAYVAYCPKCAGSMTIRVSPYGSDSHFFTAG